MDLTKAGQGYIRQSGIMLLKVTKYVNRSAGKNQWHDYALQNEQGEETKVSFLDSEKAMFLMAGFARACGITDKTKLENYHPDHAVGCKLQIAIVPSGKYYQGQPQFWWPEGATVPADALQQAIADSQKRGVATQVADDLPFDAAPTTAGGPGKW